VELQPANHAYLQIQHILQVLQGLAVLPKKIKLKDMSNSLEVDFLME
jgi:hypothetical protein